MAKSKERGAWLTIWLSFILISGIFSLVSFILTGISSAGFPSQFPAWVYPVLGFISILNIIFIIFLFFWKKWAFYAFLTSVIVVFAINTYIGIPIYVALLGFIGVVVLYFSMRSRWKLFD